MNQVVNPKQKICSPPLLWGIWIHVKSYNYNGNLMKKFEKTTKVSVWHFCLHNHILPLTFYYWEIMTNKHIFLTSHNQLVVCDEFEQYCIIITTISRLGMSHTNFQGFNVRYKSLYDFKWYNISNLNVSEGALYTSAMKKITSNSKLNLVYCRG